MADHQPRRDDRPAKASNLERDARDAIDRLVDTLAVVSMCRPRDAAAAKVRGGGSRASGKSPHVSDPVGAQAIGWEAELDATVWWLVGGWRDGPDGRPEEVDGFVQRAATMMERFDPADPNEVIGLVDNLRGTSPTSPLAWRRALRAVGTWVNGAVTVLHEGWQASYRARLVQPITGLDVEDEDADRRCTWLLTELTELLMPLVRRADLAEHRPARPRDIVHCEGRCDGANLAKYPKLKRCDTCRRHELRLQAELADLEQRTG